MLACAQPIKDGPSFFTGQPPALFTGQPPALFTGQPHALFTGQPHALAHGTSIYNTQNDLLLHKVLRFYHENDGENMDKMLAVINGTTNISLRIMDWFVTNYSKKHYTVYDLVGEGNAAATAATRPKRFKVYVDYKLKLRAYSKKRFDPFCRWDRINVPHQNGTTYIQTTLGQLNFFKWAIENEVLRYIHENYTAIETDMNIRNNTTRKLAKSHQTSSATIDGSEFVVAPCASNPKVGPSLEGAPPGAKHRKKREELSLSATKSIKKEFVDIVITFN